MDLNQLQAYAMEHGGLNYSINSGEYNPELGYLISIKSRDESSPYMNKKVMADFLKKNIDLLALDDHYMGIWLDCGLWDLEVTQHTLDVIEAIEIGRKNDCDVVYDCRNKIPIFLNPTPWYT